MKSARRVRIAIYIFLIFFFSLFLPCDPRLESLVYGQISPSALQVLFVGNSFTYGRNMPALVEFLSMSTDRPIKAEMAVKGGVYLRWHVEQEATRKRIAERQWDFVVLQDCSNCPLDYFPYFEAGVEEMVKYVRKTGNTPVLFMTWADRGHLNDQQKISQAYLDIGKRLNVEVVPVGIAWERAQKQFPDIVLHDKDNHHAGDYGALLTAYVFIRFFGGNLQHPFGKVRLPARYLFHLILPEIKEYADSITARKLWSIAEDVPLR